MDTLNEAIKNLKLWTTEDNTADSQASNPEEMISTLQQLVEVLNKEENDRSALCESLVKINVVDALMVLLTLQNNMETSSVREKTAEIVAELAKTDVGRKHCTNCSIISSLLELLLNENNEVSIQACRALGNICYDNDNARSIVYEQEGTEKLLKCLQSVHITKTGKEQLRTVATGFLLNLVNTYDMTQERVLELDVLSILCDYLTKYGHEEDVCIHVLLVLNCLADSENGRKKIIEKNICGVLVGLMEIEVSSDVVEAVLELIGNLAEDDIVKYQLTTTGFCHNLIKILKTNQTSPEEESLNVTKVACDLIVLMLTGDASMESLYDNGQGVVYQEIVSWLSSKDETLQTAAALAIGNFARKDAHCTQMVSGGIIKQLLDLLKRHNTKDGDIRLQHAILSALRNLAIPGVNKGALLEMGVMETVIPMITVETFPVVFKLLGTLRMLVDGQEEAATKLGKNHECIRRFVEWCAIEDHPGVKGEATRLLAWLIKNSKSIEVMKPIVQLGGLPFLVSMAKSEHEVMQNEALVALSLICSSDLVMAEEMLLNSELSSNLCKLLSEEEVHAEVKCNILTLITILTKSDKMKEDLTKAGIPEVVAKFSEVENEVLSEAAKAVKQLFESG